MLNYVFYVLLIFYQSISNIGNMFNNTVITPHITPFTKHDVILHLGILMIL